MWWNGEQTGIQKCSDGNVEYMLQGMREILGEIPLLFTFRTQQEGGEQAIELLAYQELNERAAGTKLVDLIDAELSSGEETVKKS